MKRVFLIVLDSVGIGELPDAGAYGDKGSNTLLAASGAEGFAMPNMQKLGLFNIDNVKADGVSPAEQPKGAYGRFAEVSNGKDTTTGHWEIAGIISKEPLPVFPDGFPKELIDSFEKQTGRKVLCNKPYSGTQVIKDYGQEHIETGALIVYTSADSVFQIAAHEEVIPVPELYRYCEIARELCTGKYGVGRIIARPFVGDYPEFKRTANRHDYSIVPPAKTMLDYLKDAGKEVRAVGKINDIFAGMGITDAVKTSSNSDGIDKTIQNLKLDFEGLSFTNLVDFDSSYGHRNDVQGYGDALSYFDKRLPEILELLKEEDILMVTADHGCDPHTESTDHSREYVPLVIYGKNIKNTNLGTRNSFSDIAATILEYFGVKGDVAGTSFMDLILK